MEKQIIEILINHFGWQRKESCDKSAKEIADIFRKFIEYLTNAQLYFRDGHEMTLDGAFEDWWNNLKDK